MDARARGNATYQTFNQAGIRARGRPARCLVHRACWLRHGPIRVAIVRRRNMVWPARADVGDRNLPCGRMP
jgi:hypothetical protein